MRKTGAIAAMCGAVALLWTTGASATRFVGTGGIPNACNAHTSAATQSEGVEQGQLESVGPSQRSLRIGYCGMWGGTTCPAVEPIPTVTESDASVTIAIRQQAETWTNCRVGLFTTTGSLVVNLKAPLAGRSVLGLSLGNGALSHVDPRYSDTSPSTSFPLRIHSVIGLSPADAKLMLRYRDHSVPAHYRGPPPIVQIVVRHTGQPECPLPVVVGQQPAPGAVIRKQGSQVVLLVAPAIPPCGPGSCPYRGC